MNFIKDWAGLVALVVLAVSGVSGLLGHGFSLGGTTGPGPTQYQAWHFLQGFASGARDQFQVSNTGQVTIGTNGTQVSRLNAGPCYIQTYAATITASTTATVDCQANHNTFNTNTTLDSVLTGVTFGDNVVANLSTTTSGTTFGSLVLVGVSASTTPGFIQLQIANHTGATYTWPTTGYATGTVNFVDTH